MVDIKHKKYGFSLAEALVSMLVISIFFVATSKIMTQKQRTDDFASNPHGYIECYFISPSQLREHRKGSEVTVVSSRCLVQPVSGVPFYSIYSVRPAGGGSFTVTRSIEPVINHEVHVRPGSGVKAVDEASYTQIEGEESSIGDFNAYLQATNPDSELAKRLASGANPQGAAIFISW